MKGRKSNKLAPKGKKPGYPCPKCGGEMNTWDVRAAKALGYRTYQVCEGCLCKEYGKSREELRDILEAHLGMRPCQGI